MSSAPPPRVLSAASGRAVALGARRRQSGLIAGALAPLSLQRPLSGQPGGRPGGQAGGGWRQQARRASRGVRVRLLLRTQGGDCSSAMRSWAPAAPVHPKLEPATCPAQEAGLAPALLNPQGLLSTGPGDLHLHEVAAFEYHLSFTDQNKQHHFPKMLLVSR